MSRLPCHQPWLAVLLPVLAVASAGCRRPGSPSCGPRPDHSVIACLDGVAIGRHEVAQHLREPVPVPGQADLPDPRATAVEAAVRVRLFAAEAVRRQLPAPAGGAPSRRNAMLNQALIRDEQTHSGLDPSTITAGQAADYLHTHPSLRKVGDVQCRGIFVTDPRRAELLYAELRGATDEQFADAARRWSEAPSASNGGLLPNLHDMQGGGSALVRLSRTLRVKGAVGGPVRADNGLYAVLFAAQVEPRPQPLDDLEVRRIANFMAETRKREHLDELYATLRRRADLQIFPEELEALPAPRPRALPSAKP